MFSSDEWRCHAMLRHPVVSHHMPLDWTLAKTTLEWKRRLFRRCRATPVLISLATATPVISFLVVFFCFVLSASRSSSCFALSARLERHRLVCHVKDHLERLWLELSKRLARIQVLESQLLRAVNTEIHLLHQIQTSWKSDMFTGQKRGEKNRFIQRGLQTCSVPFSMPWTRSSMSTASGANYFDPKWLPRGTSLPSTLVQQLFITPC